MDKDPVIFQIYNSKFKILTQLEFGPKISEVLRYYLATYQKKVTTYDDGKSISSSDKSIPGL